MRTMEAKQINVFGEKIVIVPEAFIVTVKKISESEVELKSTCQGENTATKYINSLKVYGKTADEFVDEFRKKNHIETYNSFGS